MDLVTSNFYRLESHNHLEISSTFLEGGRLDFLHTLHFFL